MLIIAAQSLSELPFIACYKPEFYTILGLKNTKEKYMKVISFSGSKLIKRIGGLMLCHAFRQLALVWLGMEHFMYLLISVKVGGAV